jgi:dTDP-4-amino-4,6-dideoxygalactose transaminase
LREGGPSLVQFLRNSGVAAITWPGDELPIDIFLNNRFPNSALFNDRFVHLPVHNSLEESDMVHTFRLVQKFYQHGASKD